MNAHAHAPITRFFLIVSVVVLTRFFPRRRCGLRRRRRPRLDHALK